MKLLWTLLVPMCAGFISVRGDFILTVNFINYTNPTGLCAECQTRLDQVTRADQLVPVCCDEQPFRTDNCNNTGDARCDTRFRWAIRPFGALLETRPVSVPNAPFPPYFFTPCPDSSTTCPFSEMSTTFGQGNTGFLGVAANPLPVMSRTITAWTGRVQFYIEPIDSRLPNIIDSFLVNLNNLQLGAAFTEEMTFTGFHNISCMTMSFRVECAPGFCGSDCTTTPLNNSKIAECQRNGDFTCINSGLNQFDGCSSCLHNLDIATNCTTCLETGFDQATNCTVCLNPGYNISSNCMNITCFNPIFDPSTTCTSCLDSIFNFSDGCTSCLVENYDPQTNCTQCLSGWDVNTNCASCLPNRDLATSCSLCLPGFSGESCDPEVGGASVALVGGIAGGVGGALLLVVLAMTVVIILLTHYIRRTRSINTNRTGNEPVETLTMSNIGQLNDHTKSIQLQANVLYGLSNDNKLDHQYETVDTPIAMTYNPVYSAAKESKQSQANAQQLSTNDRLSADDQTDYYVNEGLGPQTNEQRREYDDQTDYYVNKGLEPQTKREYDYVQV